MGRDYFIHKYECSECPYGCTGHIVEFKGSSTSNTGKLLIDGKEITPFLLYDDFKAIREVLKEV